MNQYNVWSSEYVTSSGWTSPVMVNSTPDNTDDPQLVVDKQGVATVVWVQSSSIYSSHSQ